MHPKTHSCYSSILNAFLWKIYLNRRVHHQIIWILNFQLQEFELVNRNTISCNGKALASMVRSHSEGSIVTLELQLYFLRWLKLHQKDILRVNIVLWSSIDVESIREVWKFQLWVSIKFQQGYSKCWNSQIVNCEFIPLDILFFKL